jgi:hypothetical protein
MSLVVATMTVKSGGWLSRATVPSIMSFLGGI